LILADIGNRHAHIWSDGIVKHLLVADAIDTLGDERVYYISVNSHYSDAISALEGWIDISSGISISGEYPTMGIDRKALCLSRGDGVYVDAGSAITVDVVEGGCYVGGFILLGLHSYEQAYADIAPILRVDIDRAVDIYELPRGTRAGVSYGAVAPIVASIERVSSGRAIYFTGGDGEWLSRYFQEAVFDQELLFEGMRRAVEKLKCFE